MSTPIFDRSEPTDARITLEWEQGVSWIAHPDEGGQRASHAIRTPEGVWLFDPIDAPAIEDHLRSLGDVIGVAVCSRYHARDAETFARRHDVSVHVPDWMDRIESRVDAPIVRSTDLLDERFRTIPCRPLPIWKELFCYHEATKTLLIPDSLGSIAPWTVGDERLGLELFRRLQPPRALAELDVERILVGHGDPVTEEANAALASALTGARRSFPKALLKTGPQTMKAIASAM